MGTVTDRAFVLDGIFWSASGREILRGAYVRAEPGSVLAIVGPNGCGKSSLLRIATAEVRPDSGIVIIDDLRLGTPSRRNLFEHVGYLPQRTMLPGDMQVRTLLASLPVASRTISNDRLVEPFLRRRIGSLSTGERRSLELLIVLSLDRRYYFLDEPFTGLDPMTIERFSGAIRSRAEEGRGIIVTDHYLHAIMHIADEVSVMHDGRCRRLREGETMT